MKLSHWIKCLDGDHRYIRKVVDLKSEETEQDFAEWFRVYDGYLERYGFNPKYLKILKALKNIALLELRWVRTRDPFIETKIAIEREKLAQLRKDHGPGVSTEKALIFIGKWYGGPPLNPDALTVTQYEELRAAYMEAMKGAKAQRTRERKNKAKR